jgi:hypothetical protein
LSCDLALFSKVEPYCRLCLSQGGFELLAFIISDEFSSTDLGKDKAYRKISTSEIEKNLKTIIEFKISPRTLVYIEKRLGEVDPEENFQKTLTQ